LDELAGGTGSCVPTSIVGHLEIAGYASARKQIRFLGT
jgi:hypothetical protein